MTLGSESFGAITVELHAAAPRRVLGFYMRPKWVITCTRGAVEKEIQVFDDAMAALNAMGCIIAVLKFQHEKIE